MWLTDLTHLRIPRRSCEPQYLRAFCALFSIAVHSFSLLYERLYCTAATQWEGLHRLTAMEFVIPGVFDAKWAIKVYQS